MLEHLSDPWVVALISIPGGIAIKLGYDIFTGPKDKSIPLSKDGFLTAEAVKINCVDRQKVCGQLMDVRFDRIELQIEAMARAIDVRLVAGDARFGKMESTMHKLVEIANQAKKGRTAGNL